MKTTIRDIMNKKSGPEGVTIKKLTVLINFYLYCGTILRGCIFWSTRYYVVFRSTFLLMLGFLVKTSIPKTSATKTSTNRNVYKPKRLQTKIRSTSLLSIFCFYLDPTKTKKQQKGSFTEFNHPSKYTTSPSFATKPNQTNTQPAPHSQPNRTKACVDQNPTTWVDQNPKSVKTLIKILHQKRWSK